MGGQKTEGTNYTVHIVVFLLLTVFMYVFAYVLVVLAERPPRRRRARPGSTGNPRPPHTKCESPSLRTLRPELTDSEYPRATRERRH